jgi:glycerophosphoryl diester phosphodiesterase
MAIGVQDVVARAHARDLRVFTWTLRPENGFLVPGFRTSTQRAEWGEWRDEWRLILSTGIDGVFLDHPDLLAEVLD